MLLWATRRRIDQLHLLHLMHMIRIAQLLEIGHAERLLIGKLLLNLNGIATECLLQLQLLLELLQLFMGNLQVLLALNGHLLCGAL